jgi:hypothetical protein
MTIPAVLTKRRWSIGYRFKSSDVYCWMPEFNADQQEAYGLQTKLSKDFHNAEWALIEQTGEWQ